MSDHITPISGRDSLTPKKYQYRFLALSRADAAARPCRVSIEAATEQEARRALAPLFILSLAARLPAQEAHHA
ncbi:host cell division inhibitor Icd-like protein [Erwinia sp. S38]|uniref:host cell division inhibitor Icd-like protein n=1 Tax=Erwinia sp. S38 TaxID=2769338 RepID=UPI00190955E7|nr:host cell division inhibitor Icd-like protein [Erwinia sp. S38]MBK0001426.1 host cell division inhibitor Icd-like protein [Erwinia sp. S38]